MSRESCGVVAAALLGFTAGLLVCILLLGVRVDRHEPGLWTVRFRRILGCGLDYNGPPYTSGPVNVWLTCGDEDRSWRVWPVGGE